MFMSNNKAKTMYKVFYYYFIISGSSGMNMPFVTTPNLAHTVTK